MSGDTTRRDFVKSAAVTATAAAVGTAVGGAPGSAQDVMQINPEAQAIMPDGKILTRPEILMQLGLDPNSPNDAWLAILGCGSNAAALDPKSLKDAVDRGLIDPNVLDPSSLDKLKQMQ
jgi:hypothetical protein